MHPLVDDLTLHLREQQISELINETAEATFHIHRLRLNRPQLIEHRRRKYADQKTHNEVKVLRQQIHDLQQELDQLNLSIQETLTEIDQETT